MPKKTEQIVMTRSELNRTFELWEQYRRRERVRQPIRKMSAKEYGKTLAGSFLEFLDKARRVRPEPPGRPRGTNRGWDTV